MSPRSALLSSVQDCNRRARASRRHLPQLGLHSDQSAAALGRNLSLHAARQGVRAQRPITVVRRQGRSAALARRLQAPQQRRRLPDEEEQDDVIWGEATIEKPGEIGEGAADPRRQRARWGRAPIRQSTSSSRPARARACCRGSKPTGSWFGPISRRWCPTPCPSRCSSSAPVRSASNSPLLPHHGRRGDGRRGAAADPARRGCRDRRLRPQELREAGHQDLDRRQGDQTRQEGASVVATVETAMARRKLSRPSG